MNGTRKKKAGAKETEAVVQAYGQRWKGVSEATTEDVEKLEAVVGAKLPAELKDFMRTCSGGIPEKDFYESDESDAEIGIGYVLPLREDRKRMSATAEIELYRDKQALPRELVPFAYDRGHANLICLRLKENDIVYWLHDDDKKPIRYVAPSLTEFLKGLGECPF